jgi:glycosyltransferase involved in cell wall biosynthesis
MTSRRLKRKPIKNPGETGLISVGSEAVQPDLVSILISNYNYAQFVGASINSAAHQTYGNIEIIVVDDGSTDHSVSEISDTMVYLPSVQLIVQENAGQAAAMNAAFAAAKGKFLVFLDSDDILDPDAVVEALKALRTDTAFVQFYLRTINRNGRPAGLHPFCHSIESGEMFRQILSSGHFRFMPTSGNLFVRRALENVFPIPEKQWRICADTYLIASAASAGRIETLPKILGSYRTHGGNGWYKAQEGRDRLQAISRNHLQLWLDLFPFLKRIAVDRRIDDYAALSLIRRAAVGLSVAPNGTFSTGQHAVHLRALRREL